MRILHCIPTLRTGGTERFLIDLVSYQQSGELEVSVCIFDRNLAQSKLLQLLPQAVSLNFAGSLRDLTGYRAFRRELRLLVERLEPHLIHAHLWPACRFATQAVRGMGIRHLWHVHDARGWLWQKTPRAFFLRAWTKHLVATEDPYLLAVSRETAAITAGPLNMNPSSISVVPTAVNAELFKGSRAAGRRTGQPHRIVCCSNFYGGKGHATLLCALRHLAETGATFEVWFAGTGSLMSDLKDLTAKLGLAGRVRFLGQVENVPTLLQDADVFVLPSDAAEGMPIAVLEAMATGLPVVATTVGGVPEVISDQVTGRLCEPGDVEGLAELLGELLEDQEQRVRLGGSARRHIEAHHSVPTVAAKIGLEYRKLTDEPARGQDIRRRSHHHAES